MNQKIIEEFCNQSNAQSFLTSGNNLPNLDAQTQRVLTHTKDSTAVDGTLGPNPASHLLHSERIRLADGSEKCIDVYVNIDCSDITFQWV